jgi:hypothetical protein
MVVIQSRGADVLAPKMAIIDIPTTATDFQVNDCVPGAGCESVVQTSAVQAHGQGLMNVRHNIPLKIRNCSAWLLV